MRLVVSLTCGCMIWLILAGGSALAQESAVSTAGKADSKVQVRLEAKGGQTHFRIGDLIPLELVFSNPGFVPSPESEKLTPIQRAMRAQLPQPGQHVVNSVDYGDLADTVAISPATGWFQWQGKSGHDYLSAQELTNHEMRVPLVLNQGYVFREPGHYEISVTTYRLDGKPVTTDPIGLDLTARPTDEERALVRSLNFEIANRKKPGGRCRCATGNLPAEQLAALPGDDAVRAKVHWLLDVGDDHDDVRQAIEGGLAASRNYDLQLLLLEDAWHNLQRAPDSTLQNAITATRLYQAGKMRTGWRMIAEPQTRDAGDRRMWDENRADVQAIVDSLSQRSGQNLTDTVSFLMLSAKADARQLAVVRPVAITEFGHMDPMEQGMMLQAAWWKIRDPLLVPALRAMLDKPPAQFVGYGQPLERLIELDPASARPYALREICDPGSNVQMKQMAALPDETLPETDACLLRQMTANAAINKPAGVTPWPEKALIAARFASSAIYPQMLALYRAHPEWNDTVRGATIAYLVRWHPETAAELLPPSVREKSPYLVYTLNEVQAAQPAGHP